MVGNRRMTGRRRVTTSRPRVGAVGVLFAVASIAGCSATPLPSPSPTDSPIPSMATLSTTPMPAPVETAAATAAVPTGGPTATDSPEPAASPLPTVAGKLLSWISVQVPAGLVTGAGSSFQNDFFSWSHGYLAFHENLQSGSAVPWTSSDGRVWQQGPPLDMTGLAHGAWVEEVVEGPAGLLALGRVPGCADDGTGCLPAPATALWISADGLLWSKIDLQKAFGGNAIGNVSAGPTGYIAVSASSDSGTARPAIWLSADGRVWRAVTLSSATFKDAYLSEALVIKDGYLVAGRTGSLEGWGGGDFPSTTPSMWWSADGSAWSRAILPNVAEAPEAEAAIATVGAGKLVVHVGRWDCSCPPEGDTQAWTSSDGRAWKAATAAFPSPAVVLSDGRQALQLVPADGVLTVAISSDGFRWAQIVVSGSGPADDDGEAYGPAGLMVEGSDGSLWLAATS